MKKYATTHRSIRRTEKMRAALPGEKFKCPPGTLARALTRNELGGECEVKERRHVGVAGGQWVCITCVKIFALGPDKDAHCLEPGPRWSALIDPTEEQARARHVLAWRSFESYQVEVP